MAEQRSFPSRQTQDFVFGGEAGLPANLRSSVGFSRPDDTRMTRKGRPVEEKQPVRPEDVSVLEEVRYDPEAELASFLYLMVTGQVETGELSGESLKVEYEWVAGSEWELVHVRLHIGQTQRRIAIRHTWPDWLPSLQPRLRLRVPLSQSLRLASPRAQAKIPQIRY